MKVAVEKGRDSLALLVVAALTVAAMGSWMLGASSRSAARVEDSMARLHQAQERLQATLRAR